MTTTSKPTAAAAGPTVSVVPVTPWGAFCRLMDRDHDKACFCDACMADVDIIRRAEPEHWERTDTRGHPLCYWCGKGWDRIGVGPLHWQVVRIEDDEKKRHRTVHFEERMMHPECFVKHWREKAPSSKDGQDAKRGGPDGPS